MTYTIPDEKVPREIGEHTVDDVTFVIGGVENVIWRSDCERCAYLGKGNLAPYHDALRSCRSGRRSHCSCDGCF